MAELYVPVLLGTRRIGRRSLDVARFLLAGLEGDAGVATELLDLLEYDFPLLEERLDDMLEPPVLLRDFQDRLKRADALVIVAPEYKNSFPGVLKNALDYLDPGVLRRTPVGIATVSSGGNGGSNCLAQLRLVCLALGGLPIPERLAVARVEDVFAAGRPPPAELENKRRVFLEALLWYSQAVARQARSSPAD